MRHSGLRDALLVDLPEPAVDSVHDRAAAVFAAREQWIAALGAQLEGVEARRAELVQAELKRLVDKQVDIAHQLPDEIERSLQDEGARARAGGHLRSSWDFALVRSFTMRALCVSPTAVKIVNVHVIRNRGVINELQSKLRAVDLKKCVLYQ